MCSYGHAQPPTVWVLDPPLYNPSPSDRTDTVHLAINMPIVIHDTVMIIRRDTISIFTVIRDTVLMPVAAKPAQFDQMPTQTAVQGQTKFNFGYVPSDHNDYLIFKTVFTATKQYFQYKQAYAKDFTAVGNTIIFNKPVSGGSIVDLTRLK